MVILNISCATNNEIVQENTFEDKEMVDGNENILLKYPVLFIHGAGFRDKTLGFIDYWGRIPKNFLRHGIVLYYGGTDAWGAIENNAKILKNKIINILQETGAKKVNIIAHSRGGLEARYLISSLDMDYAIASLTTISTPHHGVKAMNIALEMPVGLYKFSSFFVNGWFKILGDKNPDFFTSSRQLSEIYCIEFNQNNPDKENVYYQSYAAKMKYFISDLNFMILNPLIQMTDGDNDGLCPVESAEWGDFKGIITTQGISGISHSGIIDAYRIHYKDTDIIKLYLEIAKELSKKDF
jgi:triacylglycerol lipase